MKKMFCFRPLSCVIYRLQERELLTINCIYLFISSLNMHAYIESILFSHYRTIFVTISDRERRIGIAV